MGHSYVSEDRRFLRSAMLHSKFYFQLTFLIIKNNIEEKYPKENRKINAMHQCTSKCIDQNNDLVQS